MDFVYGGSGLNRDFYRCYLRVWGERALIVQMAREAGLPAESPEDLPALRAGLARAFAPELQFLRGLPTILTAPNYVFVHGGVPSYRHMEALDAWKCMKNDNFLGQGHAFPYYCVVGHWPVSLYRAGVPCCAPLIDRDRKIASIDGGCVLQADGQLNALVLPRAGEDFFLVCLRRLPRGPGPGRPGGQPGPLHPSIGATTTWRCWNGGRSSPAAAT